MQALEILDEPEFGSRKAVTLEAGRQKAQFAFLAAVGEVTVDVDPLQEILSAEEAELFSCARGHSYKTDPYLTLPIRISQKRSGSTQYVRGTRR